MALQIRFNTMVAANGFSAAVDGVLGYPKPGVDVGDGIHVPAALSQTLHHLSVDKHPTLAQWRYQYTQQIADFLDTHPNLAGAAQRFIEERTADWDPPPP